MPSNDNLPIFGHGPANGRVDYDEGSDDIVARLLVDYRTRGVTTAGSSKDGRTNEGVREAH